MGHFGLDVRNMEGNRIVEFIQGMKIAIINIFEKRKEYKSRGRES